MQTSYARNCFVHLACDWLQRVRLGRLRRHREDYKLADKRVVQEGRGIGLGNKVKAYALQDQGQDTVEANLALGFDADSRSYDLAAAMLRDLGVRSVRLMTNNPAKRRGLEEAGIVVTNLEAHHVGLTEHNAQYLEAKREKMGHLP